MDMLRNILSQGVVHKLGWTLLHSVWQAGLIALLLVVLLRFMRKSSANLRYVTACLGLAVIVLLHVVTFCVVPASAPTSKAESVPAFPVPVTAKPHKIYDIDIPLQPSAEYMQILHTTSLKQRAMNFYVSALPYIVFGWSIGVLALSLWYFGGWVHLQRLRRKNVKRVDASLKDKLYNLAGRLKVTRTVKLMESALVQIPTVVGWLRPVILMPVSALSGLSPEQLEALLAHELAHIRRYDYLVNIFQTVVEILGFYHPAVWWISHKMRVERENCCDDLAVSVDGDKMAYVRALTSMEEIRQAQGELVIAAGGGNLFTRISRLVGNNSAEKSSPSWAPVAIAALLIMALVIPTTLALTATDSGEDLRADNVTTYAKDSVVEKTIDGSVTTHWESYLTQTAIQAQIKFDCEIYEVPSDLKIIKGKQTGNLIIDIGGEYAERLEVLNQGDNNVKLIANPTLLTLDGKQGTITSGSRVPYTAGYENGEDAGDEPKPIIRMALAGLELKIMGKVREDGQTLDLNISYREFYPSFGTHKDDEGREVQISVTESSDCTTFVSVRSGETVIIGGLRSRAGPSRSVILTITPSIQHPETGIEKRIHIVRKRPAVENEHVRVVKDFVAAVTEDKHISSLKTVKKQKDELRERLDGRVLSVQDCGVEYNTAMVIYKLEKEDDGKEVRWQVVFKLVKENGKWLIDEVDYASLGDVQKEQTTTEKPAEREAEFAREFEALKLAQEYVKKLQEESAENEQLRALEQFKVIISELAKSQQDVHKILTHFAALCAERGDFEEAAEYQEKAIENAKSQKYYGIGIAIEKKDGQVRINDVLENTPASRSSFQKGDIIKAVDGVSTEGMPLDDVVARIVGPKGTEVALSLESRGQDVNKKKTLTRQLPLEGSHVLRAYEWRLAAYKAGKTWPQYRRMLEEQKAQKTGATRIFGLKYASAEEMAEVLSRVLERRWKGVEDRPTQAVRIIPEPNRNRLIVIASEPDIQLIKALITELDVLAKRDTVAVDLKAIPPTEVEQDVPVESTITKIIKLKHADCGSVAQILQQLISDKQLKIVTDKRTNMLIVAGTESVIQEIMDLVTELDIPSREDTTATKISPSSKLTPDYPAEDAFYEIIQLKYSDCERVSEKVEKILSPDQQFQLVPFKDTNRLLILGTMSAIQQVKALAKEIDIPGSKKSSKFSTEP